MVCSNGGFGGGFGGVFGGNVIININVSGNGNDNNIIGASVYYSSLLSWIHYGSITSNSLLL